LKRLSKIKQLFKITFIYLNIIKNKKMEIQHLTRSTYAVVDLNTGETLFMGGLEECEDYLWSYEKKLERDYMY